jgi:hypothetical protein
MKELFRALTIFALASVASVVSAQNEPAWRGQGWCEQKGPPNQSPPARLNLPDWVCEAAYDAKLHTKYSVYTGIKPFFIAADLNGDRKLDAAVWVAERRTQKRGLAIFHRGNKRPIILGAGTPWEERGDDFRYVDEWSVIRRGQPISSGHDEGDEEVRLEADALMLRKSESASFAVFWNGKEYKSYQQSD